VCFARRFATYKRANLLLSQAERLQRLLLSAERPVQFVFAGKAHPADDQGKEMIRQVVAFATSLDVRHRFVFLEDYDIAVARFLYHGADVWLNTPRRPQEACGTSGMKAALNGGLNCSILDGWWDELFDGENGWAISSAEFLADADRRDEVEANSLFDLLESQIVPLYFDRFGGQIPRRWVGKVRDELVSLGPAVVATRMVKDYVRELYEPTAAQADLVGADGWAKARELASWKRHVADSWAQVAVESVEADDAVPELGAARGVEAVVDLGALSPADVEVQLLHGPVGEADQLDPTQTVTMQAVTDATPESDGGALRYAGSFTCDQAGRYGFTVRVVPSHPGLANPVELGRIAWG
jgi:starch phosphorylase